MKDQIEGTVNEQLGAAKSAVGQNIGDEKLAAEGEAQKIEGGAQKLAGEVKDQLNKAVDGVKNTIADLKK